MKNPKRWSALICAAALLLALAACGGPAASQTEEPTAEPAVTYTVTFMRGDEVLGTASAEEGAVLDASAYEAYEAAEDAEFLGWYETPSLLESSKKDLGTLAITGDMTLYGSFKSTNVAEDIRAWYVVGASPAGGPLAASQWAGASVEEPVREDYRLAATGNAVNEFSITIDLFNGDQFQVIHDWAWDGQKGYGTFTQIDDAQMANGGGLGGTSDTANVNVIMDGNYTITLTTDPDDPKQDQLSIVRNGDPLAAANAYAANENTGILVKGSWVEDWSDLRELDRVEGDGNVFTITMELEADTQLCFSVFDSGEDTGLVLKEENVKDADSLALLAENGNNIQLAEAGTYTFTVDADAMTVTVSK